MDFLQEIHRTFGSLFDSPSLFVVVASALIASMSALIAARQLSAARNTHNFQYELATRANALDYSISRNWPYRESRRAIEKAFGGVDNREQPVTVEEVERAKEQYPNIEDDLRILLGNFENLALAIHAGVADEDVAFQLLGAPFLKTADIFMPYMLAKQKVHPSRYLNLLELKKDWEKRDLRGIKFYKAYFGRNPASKNRRVR